MSDNINIDKQKLINTILNSKGSKINKNAIEKAKKGDVSEIVGSLDEENKKKLLSALSDKNQAQKILSSKEAKDIMKKFLGGGKNG